MATLLHSSRKVLRIKFRKGAAEQEIVKVEISNLNGSVGIEEVW